MDPQALEQDFPDTPEGQARRWQIEIDAAKKHFEKFHEMGERAVNRFLDIREDSTPRHSKRWNLYTANIETKQASLYGNTPKVSVTRRFSDADDDVARVGALMLERILNSDIEMDGDSYASALQSALEDRLIPGLAAGPRLRYAVEMEDTPVTPAKLGSSGEVLAPEVPSLKRKVSERVETDYLHWRDVLWSRCRVAGEMRWIAFCAKLTRRKLIERFGEDIGKLVPLATRKNKDDDTPDPWRRAEVWEIHSEEDRTVYWFVSGFGKILDSKKDPLGLTNFFPCSYPWLANVTTTDFIPRPDFHVAADLYNEVDELSTRIALLMDAARVAGFYDKANQTLGTLLDGSRRNVMIPCDNWALFAEKGGVKGVVDFFPLDMVTNAILTLRDYRREVADALFQVTGMSDIMRGQSSSPGTTATEQGIKAQFGSIRLQRLQDEFARFASQAQSIKAEIIAKHFDVETILRQSNIFHTPDKDKAVEAAQFLKSRFAEFRIEVKPESVSLTDFAALKNERLEMLQGISGFLSAAGPMVQAMPGSTPFFLRTLKWTVSGLRGSSEIEGVLDQAIKSAETAAQQPQGQQAPDPKVIAQQMKGQADLAKVQAELQADLVRTRAEVEADAQREQNQALWNTREAMVKHQLSRAASRAANDNGEGRKPGNRGVL